MTQQAIRTALENKLLTLGWADQTAFEDRAFTPTADTPYQVLNTVFAAPNDYGLTDGFLDQGFFQVRLMWPKGKGVAPSQARANQIRALFPKASPVLNTAGQQVAKVARTAEIFRLEPQADRDVTVIRIPFVER